MHVHIHTHTCIHIYMYTYTYTYTYIHTWKHIHTHTHIRVHIHIYIHICLCTHTYIYIYIYRVCTSCRKREANVYADVHNICLTYTPAHAWFCALLGLYSQLIDCICDNFGNVMKNQAIDWSLLQQLSHEDKICVCFLFFPRGVLTVCVVGGHV